MKAWLKKPLVNAYLLAVGVWIVLFCVGFTQSLWQTAAGNGGEMEIPLEQLQLISLVEQKPDPEIPAGNWLVSSDSDPQIRWNAQGRYLEQIELKMKYLLPTGAVVLYYRTPHQADFSPAQMVYAQQKGERYLFDLKGKYVEEIRIDPASRGGVILQPEQIRLYSNGIWGLVPDWQQLALLLGLPPLLLALWEICFKHILRFCLEKRKKKL